MSNLPDKYKWLDNESSPKMLVQMLKIFGVTEVQGAGDNPEILSWAKELGLENQYVHDITPWCFGKGTMIETDGILKPIENITEGELVLSHDGTFNRVLKVLSRKKETYKFSATGILDTITTSDHPYLVRKRLKDKYVKGIRQKQTSNPQWMPVNQINKGDFIAVPLQYPRIETENVTPSVSYLLGIYIAEGTGRLGAKATKKSHARSPCLYLNIAKQETAHIKKCCESAGIKQTTFSERRTCMQIEIRDRWLVKLCSKFGRIAIEKTIPMEVFSWPENVRQARLDGYMFGDGCLVKQNGRKDRFDSNTISKSLALSVLKLARSLGIRPIVRTDYREGTHVIEGRTVQVKNRHIVQWTRNHAYFRYFEADGYLWTPVREIKETGKTETVYDLSVENARSFIANGAIVHNCGLAAAIVAKRAGKEVPSGPLWALNWAKFGLPANKPMLGDVLVFKRPGGGHVGMYVAEDEIAYHVLGGNEGDKVQIIRIGKNRLYATRRPIFKTGQPANVRIIKVSASGELSTDEK